MRLRRNEGRQKKKLEREERETWWTNKRCAPAAKARLLKMSLEVSYGLVQKMCRGGGAVAGTAYELVMPVAARMFMFAWHVVRATAKK